eukprot:SAG11_NODE_976_length_6329_cov_6.100482_5_plen_115_part_00
MPNTVCLMRLIITSRQKRASPHADRLHVGPRVILSDRPSIHCVANPRRQRQQRTIIRRENMRSLPPVPHCLTLVPPTSSITPKYVVTELYSQLNPSLVNAWVPCASGPARDKQQ